MFQQVWSPRTGWPSKARIALTAGTALGAYLLYKWNQTKKEKTMASTNASSNNTGNHPAYDEPMPFGDMKTAWLQKIALKDVSISGDIEGLLFSYSIRQEYKNETDENLEIIYTFPLGWGTALLGMKANIGGKELEGKVVEKSEAEESYEKAVTNGDSAIMVQKSSNGLYTANLGNIKPGETVVVDIHCARFLSVDQGRIRIAIPTVIGERYGNPHCAGGLAPHEAARVDANVNYSFRLELSLHGDIARKQISCPTHVVAINELENGVNIILDKNAVLDKDFVLLIEGMDGYSSALCVKDGDTYMAAASFVPRLPEKTISPIGLKILVDCSGSMRGESIRQAQKGLQKIISLLTPQDFVSYSRFGSDVEHMTDRLVACDERIIEKLHSLIDATNADMGGTEMEAALQSTFSISNADKGLASAIFLITDGRVWEVKNIIESSKNSGQRIFVIGVGVASAEDLLEEMAIQTGGACEFVTPNENMAEAIVRMFQRMRGAIATNIRLDWGVPSMWQSNPPQSIYDGETVHAFALLKTELNSKPVLTWEVDGKRYSAKANLIETVSNRDLLRIGRLCQMDESQTKEEKLDIALKYQLVSDLTSLILIYERAEDEKIKGLPKIQQVPQMPVSDHRHLYDCFSPSVSSFATLSYGAPSWGSMFGGQKISKKLARLDTLVSRLDDLEAFVAWWQQGVYQWTSPQEIILEAKGNPAIKEIVVLVQRISSDLNIPEEAVWGALIPWAIQKVCGGQPIDRHSRRLLNLFQKGDEELLKENFEYWHSNATSQKWFWDIFKQPKVARS